MTTTGAQAKAWTFAKRLFGLPCTFVAGVTTPDMLPKAWCPEVAFAGRSNVGKSSLINGLTGRKNLARTSKTPGRTQQINFFKMGEILMLVDLPGYGFAQVSKGDLKAWARNIEFYLANRDTLRKVFVLIDARHPIKDMDYQMLQFLMIHGLDLQVVFTKVDTIKDADRQARLQELHTFQKNRRAIFPPAIFCSIKSQEGLRDLMVAVSHYASGAPHDL